MAGVSTNTVRSSTIDSMLETRLRKSKSSFMHKWNSILTRYGRDFDDDEILLSTMETVKFGGDNLQGEGLGEDEGSFSEDDESLEDDDDDEEEEDIEIDLTVTSPRYEKHTKQLDSQASDLSRLQDLPDDILCMDFNKLKKTSRLVDAYNMHQDVVAHWKYGYEDDGYAYDDDVFSSGEDEQTSSACESVNSDLYDQVNSDLCHDLNYDSPRMKHVRQGGRLESKSFNSTLESDCLTEGNDVSRASLHRNFSVAEHDGMKGFHSKSGHRHSHRHDSSDQRQERMKMRTASPKQDADRRMSMGSSLYGWGEFTAPKVPVKPVIAVKSGEIRPSIQSVGVSSRQNKGCEDDDGDSDNVSNKSGPVKRTPRPRVLNRTLGKDRLERCRKWVLNVAACTRSDGQKEKVLTFSQSSCSMKTKSDPGHDKTAVIRTKGDCNTSPSEMTVVRTKDDYRTDNHKHRYSQETLKMHIFKSDKNKPVRNTASEKWPSSAKKSTDNKSITPKKRKNPENAQTPSKLLSPFKRVSINTPTQSIDGRHASTAKQREPSRTDEAAQLKTPLLLKLLSSDKSLQSHLSLYTQSVKKEERSARKTILPRNGTSSDSSDGVVPLSDSDSLSSGDFDMKKRAVTPNRKCIYSSSSDDTDQETERPSIIRERRSKQKHRRNQNSSSEKENTRCKGSSVFSAKPNLRNRNDVAPSPSYKRNFRAKNKTETYSTISSGGILDDFLYSSGDEVTFLTIPTPRRKKNTTDKR